MAASAGTRFAVAQNVVLLLAAYAVAAGALGTALPAPLPPSLAAALLGGLVALLVPLPLLALRTGGVVARPAAGFAGLGCLGSIGNAARAEDGCASGGGKGGVQRPGVGADSASPVSKTVADGRGCEVGRGPEAVPCEDEGGSEGWWAPAGGRATKAARGGATVVTVWAGAEDGDELRAPLLGCKVGVCCSWHARSLRAGLVGAGNCLTGVQDGNQLWAPLPKLGWALLEVISVTRGALQASPMKLCSVGFITVSYPSCRCATHGRAGRRFAWPDNHRICLPAAAWPPRRREHPPLPGAAAGGATASQPGCHRRAGAPRA